MGSPVFARVAAPLVAAVLAFGAGPAAARSVVLGRTEGGVDYVTTGIGGIGSGPGDLVVSGVNGPVRKALLYWHGIDNSSAEAVYDNELVLLDGQRVTGTSLGDAGTNCWSAGSSRAFFADVTGLVTGNGAYELSNLNGKAGHQGNGASLVVLYDDGNPDNDRDVVFFEGNDSDILESAIPGDANGWAATLPGIQYTGGIVRAVVHAADGQFFPDGPISFTGASTVTFQDTTALWDGLSVPNAQSGRGGFDSLWDIHTFDITEAFGEPGVQTITVDGMSTTGDCHSLVVLMLDLRAGSAPCGNGSLDEGEQCDPGSPEALGCEGIETCLNDCTCGCTADYQCNDGSSCTLDTCDVESGACDLAPACPTSPGCTDTCDAVAGTCRTCGRPFSSTRCVPNSVFVLQCALDLRDCEACTSDVDASGTVTATDALQILRGCAGLPVQFDCGSPAQTTTTTQP